jgi:hypothetical protein
MLSSRRNVRFRLWRRFRNRFRLWRRFRLRFRFRLGFWRRNDYVNASVSFLCPRGYDRELIGSH